MSGSQFLSAAMLQFLAAYVLVVVVPGPIALATGGIAAVHGFRRTIPLLAGIGIGTAGLTTLVAWSAGRLASSMSATAAQATGAAVLAWLAWRLLHAAPPAAAGAGAAPPGLRTELFVQGAAIAFLAPQSASLFAVAFMGVFFRFQQASEVLAMSAVTTSVSVGWYALVAMLCSQSTVRSVTVRHHRTICRAAAGALVLMALLSSLSASRSLGLP